MKNFSYLRRMAAGLFFLTLFSNYLSAQTYNPWTSEDTTRIVKTNWLNTMGCYFDDPEQPCVECASNNTVHFRIRIRLGTNDVKPFPELRVKYFLNSSVPGGTRIDTALTPPVINDLIQPVILESGVQAYEAIFDVVLDLSNDCTIENNFVLHADFLLVTTELYQNPPMIASKPYPIDDHPVLFPPGTFERPPSGKAEPRSEKKHICCYDGVEPPFCGDTTNTVIIIPPNGNDTGNGNGSGEGEEKGGEGGGFGGQSGNRSSNSSDATMDAHFAAAFPNPFAATLQTTYQMEDAGKMEISCLDAQGRTIILNHYDHTASGLFTATLNTDDWMPGIYYICFKTADQTRTVKVVKLND